MKLLKRILICMILICILLFVLNMTIAKDIIIIEYLSTYLFCAVIVFTFFLLCLILIKNKNEVFSAITIIICFLISFSTCFTMIGISRRLHKNPQYYNVKIENLPSDYEIVLYEYGKFRGKSGCLCIKENKYVFRKIKNTKYNIMSGTLSDENNLILNYNAETKELNMKYKFSSNSEYTEQTAIIE